MVSKGPPILCCKWALFHVIGSSVLFFFMKAALKKASRAKQVREMSIRRALVFFTASEGAFYLCIYILHKTSCFFLYIVNSKGFDRYYITNMGMPMTCVKKPVSMPSVDDLLPCVVLCLFFSQPESCEFVEPWTKGECLLFCKTQGSLRALGVVYVLLSSTVEVGFSYTVDEIGPR